MGFLSSLYFGSTERGHEDVKSRIEKNKEKAERARRVSACGSVQKEAEAQNDGQDGHDVECGADRAEAEFRIASRR